MQKINWDSPFKDIDGNYHYRDDIERWFTEGHKDSKVKVNRGILKDIEKRIDEQVDKLKKERKKNEHRLSKNGYIAELEILEGCKKNLKKILLGRPQQLKMYASLYKEKISNIRYHKSTSQKNLSNKKQNLRNDILKVFNYKGYRIGKLPFLSKMLNIKCCPYCNQYFTLSFNEIKLLTSKTKKETISMFQFDHFFSKSEYPILSMSLYNLIPSCNICNQSKTNNNLSLLFHPYESDIDSIITFGLTNPTDIIIDNPNSDIIEVSLKSKDPNLQNKVNVYDNTFHISSRYSRHKDLVEEIYARIYLKKYYVDQHNFEFLIPEGQDFIKREFCGESIIDRIKFGNFNQRTNINYRPLVKFMIDINEELESFIK